MGAELPALGLDVVRVDKVLERHTLRRPGEQRTYWAAWLAPRGLRLDSGVRASQNAPN